MRKILFLALLCATVVGLSACYDNDRDDTYTYLLMHPHDLKRALDACQVQTLSSKGPSAHCAMVDKAVSQIMALIDDQRKNPEKFGQDVLRRQFELVSAEQAAKAARDQASELQSSHADVKVINEAESAYANLLIKQNELNVKVKVALAVIGLSSPE